jgi:diketogulonate reductase-like aldo/keto reductase
MAYSPLGQGALLTKRNLASIAKGLGTTPAALALRWVLRGPGVIAIPESANLEHVGANRDALSSCSTAQRSTRSMRRFRRPPGRRGSQSFDALR